MLWMTRHGSHIWSPLILGLFTFLLYVPSLQNGFVNFDDYALVRDQPIVTEHSLDSIKAAFTSYDPELYIPLTFLSYKVDHFLCGSDPLCYHLQNLLLHVVNVLLVFLLFLFLFRKKWIAFLCAFLFAVHPINVEAVAWVSARKDVLSASFFLASLVSYLRAYENNSHGRFWLSVLFFLLALMAKVSVIVLPLILLIIDWYKEGSFKIKSVTQKWPYFLLAMVFGAVAVMGKEHTLTLPITSLLILIPKSIVFSLQQFLWPLKLSTFYHYTGDIQLIKPEFLISMILFIAALGVVLISLKWTKKLAYGRAIYLILFLPSFAAFLKKGELFYFSDRYIYLAQLGLLFVIGLSLIRLQSKSIRILASGFILIIGLGFSFLAYNQSLVWRDTIALYEHAVNVHPEIFISQHNLGWVYLGEGRYDEAIVHLTKATEIDPTRPMPHANLAEAYGEKGMYEEGLKHVLRSLELDPAKEKEYKEALRLIESRARERE